MKKYIIFIFILFFSISSYSQVNIGNSLEKIKLEDKDGTLQVDQTGNGFIYLYDNKNISTIFVYFLNTHYICYATSLKPYTKKARKEWTEGLHENKDWKPITKDMWRMDLGNGIIVECTKTEDDDKKLLFIFIAKTKE